METMKLGTKTNVLKIAFISLDILEKGKDMEFLARGVAISKVVDVVEILKRRNAGKVDKIEFNTDELNGREGKMQKVSTIRVTMNPM